MAQAVRLVAAAVVGIAVGYFTDSPQLGLEAFTAVYGASGLFAPGQKTFGGKLADLKAPVASYGATIPYLRGTPRLAGIVAWSSDKRQITHDAAAGGKGGTKNTSETYTYEIDLLLEIACNRCSGLRRVWKNGALIWTNADVSDGGSLAASQTTDEWRDIRFYDGNPDQLPDPIYEAAIGVGRSPAYRGRPTVFIEGANLGESGQVPIYTFEVVADGDYEFIESPTAPFVKSGLGFPPASVSFNPAGYTMHVPQWDNGYATDRVDVYDMSTSPPTRAGYYSVLHSGLMSGTDIMTGITDVSCLVVTDRALSLSDVKIYDGTVPDGVTAAHVTFDCTGSSDLTRFCRLGDDVLFGSDFGGDTRIFRCSMSAGGTPLATSSALAQGAAALAITTDGFAWVAGTSQLYKLDLATLTLAATIATPEAGVLAAEGETLYLRGSFTFYRLDGSTWTTLANPLSDHVTAGLAVGVARGTLYNVYQNTTTGHQDEYTVYGLFPTLASGTARLDQVVRDLCLRTGQLTDDDIDVTQLESDFVRAMFISQIGPTRTTLETLSGAFFFECVEGEVLKFVKRGQAAVATIPFADLGTSDEGDGEPTSIKRLNDVELPAIVTIKYANMAADFQDGAENGDRLTTDSTTAQTVELPLGFLPSEAKQIADATTMDLATSIQQIGPIVLPMKYAALEETDVLLVTDQDGNEIRTRIAKTSDDGSSLTLDLVVDDATVINSDVVSDDSYSSSILVRTVPNTAALLMDIPALRDDDTSDVAFYATPQVRGVGWPGGELDRSTDGGTTYDRVAIFATKATSGQTLTAQDDFTGGNVFDNQTTVRVDIGPGNSLLNVAKPDLLASTQNAALFGDEIEQFSVATFVSDGVYDLSCFLRGLRGTEGATSTHVAGERFVLLDPTALRRVPDTTVDLGRALLYKSPSFGKSLAGAAAQNFTNNGVSLKPFAPVDLHVDYSTTPITLSWNRRSRMSGRFLAAGVQPALGEASEAYAVDILNGSTLVDSFNPSTPSVGIPTWSAGYTANVYQLSEVVGRGSGASITL